VPFVKFVANFIKKVADYIQITFQDISSEQLDILIAQLTMIGFEGFEEGEESLNAFIPASEFDEAAVNDIAAGKKISFTKSTIEETNWNAVWESNFEPVVVEDMTNNTPWVGIRADFHAPIKNVVHEIVITPKMSFGTGHHATTFMMVQQMGDIDFGGKTVFDFGTGTGVLAILAEKMGASHIVAMDNDDWSIDNTKENLLRNGCSMVAVEKDNAPITGFMYDIILANINKNVILDNLAALVAILRPGGILLLSGLLEEDEADIRAAVGNFTLVAGRKTTKNNWISLRFNH
jgi:ribosomal protein L11 methyltransferase